MSDLSPNARSFIESARRAHAPTAADRTRIREALNARLAAPAAAASHAAFAGPKALIAKLTVAKIVAGAVLVGAVGAGAGWVSARTTRVGAPSDPSATRAGDVSVSNTRAVQNRSSSVVPSALPTAPSIAPGDVPPTATARVLPIEPTLVATQPTTLSRPHPSPHAQAVARVATLIAPIEVSASAAPPQPVPSPASTLGEELPLVRGAQEAARHHDPAHALALLDEHATRFPHGVLREERSAARVLALCALDRRDEARIEAAELLREAPNSPHASRVRGSCVGGDGEAGGL